MHLGGILDRHGTPKCRHLIVMNSLRDSVTGAVTWHLFMDRFEHAVIRSQRRSDALAVARIAVNSRAYPNETVSVLQRGEWAAMVAQRLQSVIRADDTVATLDSERPNEFTLLLEEVSGREAVAQVFSRLLLKLETAVAVQRSLGLAFGPLWGGRQRDSTPFRCANALAGGRCLPPIARCPRSGAVWNRKHLRAVRSGAARCGIGQAGTGLRPAVWRPAKIGLTADRPDGPCLPIWFPALCKVSGCSGLLAELPPSPIPAG